MMTCSEKETSLSCSEVRFSIHYTFTFLSLRNFPQVSTLLPTTLAQLHILNNAVQPGLTLMHTLPDSGVICFTAIYWHDSAYRPASSMCLAMVLHILQFQSLQLEWPRKCQRISISGANSVRTALCSWVPLESLRWLHMWASQKVGLQYRNSIIAS